MSLANTIQLRGLTPREAIADAFYRLMSALDENDSALFNSAMMSDVTQDFNGQTRQGIEAVRAHALGVVGPLDSTHFVTNIRIDVKDDAADTATLTGNTLALHYPSGTGRSSSSRRLVGGSRHKIEMVKGGEDGLWKFQTWTIRTVWFEGDYSVMGGVLDEL